MRRPSRCTTRSGPRRSGRVARRRAARRDAHGPHRHQQLAAPARRSEAPCAPAASVADDRGRAEAARAALLHSRRRSSPELNVKRVEFAGDLSALEEDHLALDFRRAGPVLRNQLDAAIGRDRRAERRRPRRRDRVDPSAAVPSGSRAGPTTCRRRSSSFERHPAHGVRTAETQAGIVIALDTRLDDALIHEGWARDVIRQRADAAQATPTSTSPTASDSGLQIDDTALRDAVQTHLDTIAAEVLANATSRSTRSPAAAPRREFTLAGARRRRVPHARVTISGSAEPVGRVLEQVAAHARGSARASRTAPPRRGGCRAATPAGARRCAACARARRWPTGTSRSPTPRAGGRGRRRRRARWRARAGRARAAAAAAPT